MGAMGRVRWRRTGAVGAGGSLGARGEGAASPGGRIRLTARRAARFLVERGRRISGRAGVRGRLVPIRWSVALVRRAFLRSPGGRDCLECGGCSRPQEQLSRELGPTPRSRNLASRLASPGPHLVSPPASWWALPMHLGGAHLAHPPSHWCFFTRSSTCPLDLLSSDCQVQGRVQKNTGFLNGLALNDRGDWRET